MLTNKTFYILIGIFLCNFLFKLICISYPSLWYDEIISAQDTLLDFGHIKHEAEWDKNPPFYHYVLWVWSKIFGITEFSLRAMSALFSSLTAVLIFVFTKRLINQTYAVIATVIFSLHPYLYFYAQEARCYSLLIFLIMLNLITVYSLIEKPKLRTAFLLGVLNFLIFYTHYVAGLILFCQFLYLAFVFRKRFAYLLLIYLTPIVLVLLRFTKKQYNVLFFSNEMSRQKQNVPIANFKILKESIPELYISWLIVIVFLLFLGYYLFKKIKTEKCFSDPQFQFKLFIILSPIVCILMLFLLGTWTNVYHERYLIFTIPLIIISFFIFSENKNILYVFAFGVICYEAASLKFNQSKKMDYKFCAVLTKEIQKRNPVKIIVQTHDVYGLFLYYYDRDLFVSRSWLNPGLLASKNLYSIDTIEDLKNITLNPKEPILLFQTYQIKDDDLKIGEYLKGKGYDRRVTNQIEGVKCSYFKPD